MCLYPHRGRLAATAALATLTWAVLSGQGMLAQTAASAAAAQSALTWTDVRGPAEDYLRRAAVISRKEVPVGVTRPTRCQLEPGGPVAEMIWKPVRPGRYNGYWESYKSEIAAYELDKLLRLDMVPPTVEKRLDEELGAAVMWVAPTKSFKELGGPPKPPPAHVARWTRQLSRAKMFDNLIANLDPNLGNWLVDPSWNLILIDHTRSFTTTTALVHEMNLIDSELWEQMQQLTEPVVTAAIGSWIGVGEVRAILARRDRMRKTIDEMVRKKGERAVLIR